MADLIHNHKSENARFHSTHWSIVSAAGSGCDEALAELCVKYWKPLYFHVRRLGYNVSDAQDLTQNFLTRLIEKKLVTHADRNKGRFRTFLLVALRRYLINEWKRSQTTRRGGDTKTLSLDFESAEKQLSLEPWHDVTAEDLFEKNWAVELLELAFAKLESHAIAENKGDLFKQLTPQLQGDRTSKYKQIAAENEMTVAAIKMTVSRWREKLRQFVREEVGRTVDSDADADDELQRLLTVFTR